MKSDGSKRFTRREAAAAETAATETVKAISLDDDAFFLESAETEQPADLPVDQLGASYSVLMNSLAEAYQAMFPTHDHDHRHGHDHDHNHDHNHDVWHQENVFYDTNQDHQHTDDVWHDHDHADHHHRSSSADEHINLSDDHDHDLHEHDAEGDDLDKYAAGGKVGKNRTSWIRKYLSPSHIKRHNNHGHHHQDAHNDEDHEHHDHAHHHGRCDGQFTGPITTTTWLVALSCMLVISLMGLLAVGCLPLLQGPRFESLLSKFTLPRGLQGLHFLLFFYNILKCSLCAGAEEFCRCWCP
jgi:hypothetical protein